MTHVVLDPCTRCDSPLEHGDLRCAVCGARAPEELPTGSETVSVEVLRCKGCGAAVTYSAELQAAHCAFCDAVLELETVEDPLEQTEAYLPFRVDASEAREGMRKWYNRQGFFKVQDLSTRARVVELRPLLWVGWVIDAEAMISWAADSDAGSGRSRWAPHAGQVPMRFEGILVSASRGLSRSETNELARTYALEGASPEPERAPTGCVIEQFDVQRSMARGRVTRALEREAAARVEDRHVPGSRVRKLKVAALLEGLQTRRYAFPAWVAAYRYKNKLYRVVVSGHTARCVIGDSPTSWLRVLGVVLLVTLVVAAIGVGVVLAVQAS